MARVTLNGAGNECRPSAAFGKGEYSNLKDGVSVIIPVFNAEQYLTKCLDSVFAQTRKPDEVICVDDGSTDSSPAILKSYAARFPSMRILTQAHAGLVRARKTGALAARYCWSVYMDSDDWIEPDLLDKLIACETESGADLVQCGYQADYGDGNTIADTDGFTEGVYRGDAYSEFILGNLISRKAFYLANLELHAWARIYHTCQLRECQMLVPDDCNMGEDMALSVILLLRANSICISHYTGYHYCKHPTSMTGVWKGQEELDRKNIRSLAGILNSAVLEYGRNTEVLLEQIHLMIWYWRLLRLDDWKRLSHGCYLFPFGDLTGRERIILYGNGKTGRNLQRFIGSLNQLQVSGIVDQYSGGEGILSPVDLRNLQYDAVLVTIINAHISRDAYRTLRENGVPAEKIYLPDVRLLLESEIPD